MLDKVLEVIEGLGLTSEMRVEVGETLSVGVTPLVVRLNFSNLGFDYQETFEISVVGGEVEESTFVGLVVWERTVRNESVLRAKVSNASYIINQELSKMKGVAPGIKVYYDLARETQILMVTRTKMTVGLSPVEVEELLSTPLFNDNSSELERKMWLDSYRDVLLCCSHPLDYFAFAKEFLSFIKTRRKVGKLIEGVGRPFNKIKNGRAFINNGEFIAVLDVQRYEGGEDELGLTDNGKSKKRGGFVKGSRVFRYVMPPVLIENNASFYYPLERMVLEHYGGDYS